MPFDRFRGPTAPPAMVQAAASVRDHPAGTRIDPHPPTVVEACAAAAPADGDDVVVCGSRDAESRYRLKPLDASRFERVRRAETALAGDLKGAAVVESKEIAPGVVSNRVMLRLKLPF